MYKVKNSLAPEHICNIFYKQFKNYNLCSSDFPIPSFNTVNYTYGKHSLRYLAPYLWGKYTRTFTSKQAFMNLKKQFGPLMYRLCWTEDLAAMHARHKFLLKKNWHK